MDSQSFVQDSFNRQSMNVVSESSEVEGRALGAVDTPDSNHMVPYFYPNVIDHT